MRILFQCCSFNTGVGGLVVRRNITLYKLQYCPYSCVCFHSNQLSLRYSITDRCNEVDWYQYDMKCYKFYLNANASWDEASRTCAQEGGSLGMVKLKGGLYFVKDFLQRQNSLAEQIMVGLRKVRGLLSIFEFSLKMITQQRYDMIIILKVFYLY